MLRKKLKNLFKIPQIIRRFPCSTCWSMITLAAGTCFNISCNNQANIPSNPTAYNKVIDSAIAEYHHQKPEKAVFYLDSVSRYFKNPGILQKFEFYSIHYNYAFHVKRDYDKAMLYADSILNLFKTDDTKSTYSTKLAQAYSFKGDVLFEEGRFNDAYQYFFRGKSIAKKDGNQCALGDFSYHMGMIMYRQENFRPAAAHFIKGWEETGFCDLTFNFFYRRQELLSNAGLCYSKINETDSAMVYFQKAITFIEKSKTQFNTYQQQCDVAIGVIYGNEANIYIKHKNFSQAKRLLKKSIEINLRKRNDNQDAMFSELKLARIYDQLNETDSLNNLLQVVKTQFDTIKNIYALSDWNLLMSNYFSKKKNPGEALAFYKKYDLLEDSIAAKNKLMMEADVTQQIKRIEQNSEFVTLKKDNLQQNLVLKIGAVFGSLVLIIFFLILWNLRKSRKNIEALGNLNHQINDQNFSLENALQELKQSSQEKDRILRTVAHDLRNPIGGIASLTMVMAGDGYTDEQKEMIGLISETSKNSLELINEILEVTNNGIVQLNKETVEINALINNSVELLRFKAAEKGQHIALQLLDTPVELFISREKIWRVIGNLISNAIKFSAPDGEISVLIENKLNAIEISVKDRGIGIPDQLKDKVFHMFTVAKRPGTQGEKSFGLGLSISKQIIEAHSGKIWFESVKGVGTTFYVSLPKSS